MSDNVLIAIIAGSAVVIGAFATSLVAIVALRTSDRRFESLDKRLDDMNARLDRIDARLGLIEQDLKEFFKDITRLKIHTKLD